MHAVGVKELKNRLSEYLREVARGEVVLVTDRGRVVAELRQPAARTGEAVDPERARMDAIVLRLGGRPALRPNSPDLYRPTGVHLKEGTSREVLDWLREDKR